MDATPDAKRPATNLRWWIAILLGFGVLVNYFDRVNLSAASQSLDKEFGIGPAGFGILSSAYSYTYAALQVPMGVLLDRIGVTLIGRASALLWSVASVLTAISTGFATFFAARLVLGVAEAPTFPANSKATGYWFPLQERGLATACFDAAAKFGTAIAIPIVSIIVFNSGWRSAFWFTAALSLVFFIAFYFLYRNPSDSKRLSAEERDYIKAGGAQPEGASAVGGGTKLAYLLQQRKVWGLTIGFAAYGYTFYLFLTWLPAYLATSLHMSIIKSGLYAAIPWLVATATDLLVGGWLVDYLITRGHDPSRVRKWVVVIGMLMGLAIIGAAKTTDPNVAVFWISVSLGGLAASAPVGWSIPSIIAPKGSVSSVGGIMNFANNLMGILAPTVTGFIVGATNSFTNAFLTAGAVLVIGILSYIFVLGRIEPIPEPA